MTNLVLAFLLLCRPGYPESCNARSLQKALDEATSRSVATAFLALAACDGKMAAEAATAAFPRMLPSDDTPKAVMKAVEVGASAAARTWIVGILPSERAALLTWFGANCSESPAVLPFLAESRTALGEAFWDDRWHRAVIGCQDPAAMELIRSGLQDEDVVRSPRRFASTLEVFTTNWGGATIPYLKALLVTTQGENQTAVLQALVDAAGVRSLAGADPKAVADAIVAVVDVAPTLPPEQVVAARNVLTLLGDTDAASRLASAYYKEKVRDGALHWGLVVAEQASCKKGKTALGVHTSEAVDPVPGWRDELATPVETAANAAWKLDLAQRCGGTSTLEIRLSDEPLMDDAALKAWTDAEVLQYRRRVVNKLTVTQEAALTIP